MMSETLLSFTIIFAQLGGALLLAVIAWVVYFIYCTRKEERNIREFIELVKKSIPQHRKKLIEYFKTEQHLDDKITELNVEVLISREKKLFDDLIKASISRDMSILKLTTGDVNALINDYVRLLKHTIGNDADGSINSRELKLKKLSEELRIENISLQNRLDSATETIENMMGEFSSMYEGGKKEGEQRVKNEMYKLKQSLQSEEAKAKAETAKFEVNQVSKDSDGE